jgi:hypothetical protein
VCDDERLFIAARPRTGANGRKYEWHIAVNNPTDGPVTATFRPGMVLPGLTFAPRRETVPAGANVTLAP